MVSLFNSMWRQVMNGLCSSFPEKFCEIAVSTDYILRKNLTDRRTHATFSKFVIKFRIVIDFWKTIP